jgi:hypothetical protein
MPIACCLPLAANCLSPAAFCLPSSARYQQLAAYYPTAVTNIASVNLKLNSFIALNFLTFTLPLNLALRTFRKFEGHADYFGKHFRTKIRGLNLVL